VWGGESPSTAVCGRKRVAIITLWFLYELMVVEGKSSGEQCGPSTSAMMLYLERKRRTP
jgi:hypothetical protein